VLSSSTRRPAATEAMRAVFIATVDAPAPCPQPITRTMRDDRPGSLASMAW